ncbi:GNAT family N-acetyltransferase [Pontibacter korlensis]|uniref:GNAT family acetyltransferase n=1 Tax=Pontibacter korlensis TaxID=400092 RepID=A0A0E3ZJF1_9BACT|nr:GNAT family N-acetyltransferase [Pontibacter korlensis]AKD05198.1 GNAT family acetyltransferase [Pontibacter korlensis]
MIRPYSSQDKEELLELLRLNTPQYFAEEEEADFIEYLNKHVESYFVVEVEGKIIGSGGINYFPDKTARISWDIIHPAYQGKGVGKELLQYRVDYIRRNASVEVIYVRTTQLVYKFYEKAGFTLEKTEKDFWAEGFDLYQMKMVL